MPVINNSKVEKFELPGIVHQTLAGRARGVENVEVWIERVQPGAGTPVHRHDCEEIVVVLRGSGHVIFDGKSTDFGPNSTIIAPPGVVHQIINTGDEEMLLVAAFGRTPVGIFTEDGEPLPVPWQSE
ncbi:MAG TPA: cupin domain-containing protein [Blastocatellia bacterium]|nr:cupin domain-containing protein [Blastocatellia bacterium]